MMKLSKTDFSYQSMISAGAGTDANQVRSPNGVAVDDNYLYIVDSYYHRVKKYDKNSYALIGTIGGTAAGSGDTQFSTPRGIAVDDNYIYVTESGYRRIKKFDKTTLAFVSKACGTSSGSGNDQLNTPTGVFVDDNYIYIADTANNRIMIRNKDLNMTYYNKVSSSGAAGTTNNLNYNYGVTVDDNYIYITDYYNHRLKKYNKSDYSLVSIYSGLSITTESITAPVGIVSDNNYIYYLDMGLHRLIKRRISDMAVVGYFGGPYTGSTSTTLYNPYYLAIDDNYLYVADQSNGAVKKYNKSDLSWVYTYAPGTSIIRTTTGVAVDGNYLYLTTAYTGLHKLFKINIITTPWVIDANIGGAAASDNNSFSSPYGVAVYGDYVYVADYTNNRIKKHLKSDLSFVSQFGLTLYSNYFPNVLSGPVSVLIDNNYIYVSNAGHATIRKYDLDFNYISAIGFSAGFAADEMMAPRGMTISNGYMYVADYTIGKIIKET